MGDEARPGAVPVPPAARSTGSFTIELVHRVELGTPDAFLQWVNEKFGAQIPPLHELQAQVPAPLRNVLEAMLRMKISIETLAIKTGPEGYRRFAASVDFTDAPPRLGNVLELDKIAFRIESGKAVEAGRPAS